MTKDDLDTAFWAVIPAGGSGTRLWPLSRADRPKFLLPLLGERSLLQQTWDRLVPLAHAPNVMVVAGPAHADEISQQLPDLATQHLIIEPLPRGTAPAIGLAAMLIAREDPQAVMGSFASDHAVADVVAFERALQTAYAAAKTGALVTIGLTPTRPETGYGYIERGDLPIAHSKYGTAYRALQFVEKPDLATAQSYLEAGNYFWNASMFIWRVDAFLSELQLQQPVLFDGLQQIATAWETPLRDDVMAATWSAFPNVSIDEGVMVNARSVAVVPAAMGWSDVGDWHGLGQLWQQDVDGNTNVDQLVVHDARDCVVWSDSGRLIALAGVENLVIVDTPDALLITTREQAQEVRLLVDRLKSTKSDVT